MAIHPIICAEKIVRSFLKCQLSTYPFTDPRLKAQMRELLSIDKVRRTPHLRGPYVSLSRGFREGRGNDPLSDPRRRRALNSNHVGLLGVDE